MIMPKTGLQLSNLSFGYERVGTHNVQRGHAQNASFVVGVVLFVNFGGDGNGGIYLSTVGSIRSGTVRM